jgi:hypothetical protein
VNADDALTRAVQDWRTKHQVQNDDPALAMLELVQIYLTFAPRVTLEEPVRVPSFEEFRQTIELMDDRSRAFVNQSQDLLAAVRSLTRRLNQLVAFTLAAVTLLAGAVGFLTCCLIR